MDIIKANSNKIINFRKKAIKHIPSKDERVMIPVMGDVAYEKVFEVKYWNGVEVKTAVVDNLNRKINGKTLEDIITQSMISPSGHIFITEKDKDGNQMRKFIKASNIQSCEEIWKKVNVPKTT